MLWKKDIKLEIMGNVGNYIDAIIVESQSGFKWRITGFYGHPKMHQRKESWEQLKALNRKFQLPWIFFGDFNQISSAREKMGGEPNVLKNKLMILLLLLIFVASGIWGTQVQITHGAICRKGKIECIRGWTGPQPPQDGLIISRTLGFIILLIPLLTTALS